LLVTTILKTAVAHEIILCVSLVTLLSSVFQSVSTVLAEYFITSILGCIGTFQTVIVAISWSSSSATFVSHLTQISSSTRASFPII